MESVVIHNCISVPCDTLTILSPCVPGGTVDSAPARPRSSRPPPEHETTHCKISPFSQKSGKDFSEISIQLLNQHAIQVHRKLANFGRFINVVFSACMSAVFKTLED